MIVTEDDFDIDAVRRDWVGTPLGHSRGRYPVEYDPIRRYCHMTGDTNPLFLDPDAAKRGPYGRVMCPPGFVGYFIGAGPWPRVPDEASPLPRGVPRLGKLAVNMGIEWAFTTPVLVGDHLAADWSVEDVWVKSTKLDPMSVWIRTVGAIMKDAGSPVGTWANTVMYHRPPRKARHG
jgi:acyl dehydratase